MFSSANPLPKRTLTRSKVQERATLSAPCSSLSLWPSAIGQHGDTTTCDRVVVAQGTSTKDLRTQNFDHTF